MERIKIHLASVRKFMLQTSHARQMQEEYTARGFQSSVDPVMHFGLGADSIIQSITVKWPSGKVSIYAKY